MGWCLTSLAFTKTLRPRTRLRVQALEEVSFQALQGQVTGLVGADGAGKTTLIRIAAGLLTPTSGSVTVLGLDSAGQTLEVQSAVGYMPQQFGLYQDLTVGENMDLYADLQGVPRSRRPGKYERLLEMTGLGPYTKRRAGALSGGMKQKLGLACALIKSPGILLLDEPTVGVDPVSRRELWKIVYELVNRDQIGVLVSTAYLDEAERCTQVIVLHQGRLLDQGTPEELTADMAGRVFKVTPNHDAKARRIYSSLSTRDEVVDATIHSGRVRVVMKSAGESASVSQLYNERIEVEAATANFEDAFMALIPRAGHLFRPGTEGSEAVKSEQGEADIVVRASSLKKIFGDFVAVNDLDFEVRRGEIFGLLGSNGAGKSTTFRMLCGLLPASGGEISVAGYGLRHSRARARAKLGYMAQRFSLYGQLTCRENLSFFGKAYGLSGKRLKQRLQWACEEFNLEAWRDKAARSLPGGYKQRLAMAAALLHEPEILFLDEPTSGVDPFARREFWLRINDFAEQGVTVVVTTHFMEEAEYCDRMLIMSQGEILAMGDPAEIRSLARSPENPQPTMEDAFIALASGNLAGEDSGQGGGAEEGGSE